MTFKRLQISQNTPEIDCPYVTFAPQKYRSSQPSKIVDKAVLQWMWVHSCNRNILSKLMVPLMNHLIKWFAVRKSMHDVENKVLANKEEYNMFGHLNWARDLVNVPNPRKLPVVKPRESSKENSINNSSVKENLVDCFNNFASPFTIIALFVPRPWTFFNFVLFYESKFKLIQNVVKQIDQKDCLRFLNNIIENDSLSIS